MSQYPPPPSDLVDEPPYDRAEANPVFRELVDVINWLYVQSGVAAAGQNAEPPHTDRWQTLGLDSELHYRIGYVAAVVYDVLMKMGKPYDWPTWAKDTDPESGKATAEQARSVMEGLDALLGKW